MSEERAARSVFVGNIPYDATEESLKEIFCQVGQVVSFRLVYDRETGKPKGYGFCEYQDLETAQSAMRNLNNYDLNGRQLRVGIAAGEQSKEEGKPAMPQSFGGPSFESPYGEPVEPEKAPEAISRAVASLPPEQMFELMKQMKLCIQNNPNEARNMLLQNPQLAYALLQAQIVMKIVDPQVALAMLHRQAEQIPPIQPTTSTTSAGQLAAAVLESKIDPNSYSGPMGDVSRNPATSGVMGPRAEFGGPVGAAVAPRPRGGLLGDMPMGGVREPIPGGPQSSLGSIRGQSMPGDPHGQIQPNMGMRGGNDFGGPRGPVGPVRIAPVPRESMDPHVVDPRLMDSRSMGPRPDGGMLDPRSRRLGSEGVGSPVGTSRVDLGGPQRDPRQSGGSLRPPGPSGVNTRPNMSQPSTSAASGVSKQDQEKAQLIMQVLQLSDEQIAMLPPDQRQSILILKEQIARSASQTS